MFKNLIGIPFEYGKMDCWNLAIEVFKRYKIDIPKYNVARAAIDECNLKKVSELMEIKTNEWIECKEPSTPCIIAISLGVPGFINHVGVYIGNGRFIHTTNRIGSVTIERLSNPIYANRKYYTFNSDYRPV